MRTLQTLDYTAIVIYMAMMAGIGIFLGRYVKNIGDYFKGDSQVPWLAGAISNFMTMFSTFIFVAYAGIAYEHGLVALTILWSSVPPALFAAFILAKRWRRAGIITPVEFLETRFNAPVRQIFSWGGVAFKILDNMVRLYAIGLFVAAATPLSLETSILLSGMVVVVYTVMGGLWAVVVTDAVQFVILIFTTLILVPLSLRAVGGLEVLAQQIPAHFSWTNGPKGAPLFLIAYYIMVLIKFSGNWAFIQRFYSVRDEAAGKKVGLVSAALFMVFPVFFLLPAIAAKVLLPNLADKEMAYVSMCLELLPQGIMGLMIAAMFAATMSTVSAEYNVVAGVLTGDIYKRLIHPSASPRNLMLVARSSTLVVGSLVTLGALFVGRFGGAFEANKLFTGLFAIPMVIPLIFGILLRRPQPWGALLTVVAGIVAGLILNQKPEISWEAATLIEIGLCLAVFLLSGLIKNRDAAYLERVRIFFQRLATPVPEKDKPAAQSAFLTSIAYLFAVALGSTGVLFILMSIPSVSDISGQLSMASGILCLITAGILWLSSKNGANKREAIQVTASEKKAIIHQE
ncbi:sodium:solute symporter family protein [Rhodocytophaga aerolata]|uniref:Sodium:solute symporter family protein n=1 Tax=Rhodocytophaga aerolata TaxID=455078 RepID=A0ABT8RC49_9BACT|nr:sodium:solute symporter family protein [Rhodocytophaga aerolata]MDO1449676.1 sodium:solute symporter family protein [Rhodocytophaga aerolata]